MGQKNNFSGIFIALEVMDRELAHKSILAMYLANLKVPIYIGHKAEIYQLSLESKSAGILFNKSVGFKNNRGTYSKLKSKGFVIVGQDEEAGIVFSKFEEFYKRRKSLKDIKEIHHWFCWSKDEYDFLKNELEIPIEKLSISGSSRSILWSTYASEFWKDEVENINSQVKDYVLFATNSVLSNSPLKEFDLLENARKKDDWLSSRKLLYESKIEFEIESNQLFISLIEKILVSSNLRIVIKVHPAESEEFWIKKFGSSPRILIVKRGPISPWILQSVFVVHNGTTSAIEARLLGKKIVAALPSKYKALDIPKDIPIKISDSIIYSANELMVIFDQISNSESSYYNMQLIQSKIAYAGTMMSLSKISEVLIKFLPDNLDSSKIESFNSRRRLLFLMSMLRTSRFRKSRKQRQMDSYKRPRLSKRYITQILHRANSLLASNDNYCITRITPNVYRIMK
jgi:surface carbohydrate biosynthesis protein